MPCCCKWCRHQPLWTAVASLAYAVSVVAVVAGMATALILCGQTLRSNGKEAHSRYLKRNHDDKRKRYSWYSARQSGYYIIDDDYAALTYCADEGKHMMELGLVPIMLALPFLLVGLVACWYVVQAVVDLVVVIAEYRDSTKDEEQTNPLAAEDEDTVTIRGQVYVRASV